MSNFESQLAIGQVRYVMGEILDSLYVPRYTVQGYRDRTSEYLATTAALTLYYNQDCWSDASNEMISSREEKQ